MKKTNVPLDTKILEGKRLAECLRSKGVVNESQFARLHGISKNGTLIYQHRKGITAISLEAALSYSRGLGVPISDFSMRLAKQQDAIVKNSSANESISENAPAKAIPQIKSKRERHVEHIVGMLEQMSEDGIQQAIGAITILHTQHPRVAKQTQK